MITDNQDQEPIYTHSTKSQTYSSLMISLDCNLVPVNLKVSFFYFVVFSSVCAGVIYFGWFANLRYINEDFWL